MVNKPLVCEGVSGFDIIYYYLMSKRACYISITIQVNVNFLTREQLIYPLKCRDILQYKFAGNCRRILKQNLQSIYRSELIKMMITI